MCGFCQKHWLMGEREQSSYDLHVTAQEPALVMGLVKGAPRRGVFSLKRYQPSPSCHRCSPAISSILSNLPHHSPSAPTECTKWEDTIGKQPSKLAALRVNNSAYDPHPDKGTLLAEIILRGQSAKLGVHKLARSAPWREAICGFPHHHLCS